MKIIEVLKELPLIDKKINKTNARIRGYASIVDTGSDNDYVLGSKEEQEKELKSLVQSSLDLAKRKRKLSRALHITNTEVNVTIDGETMSIHEWISMRTGGIQTIQSIYQSLNDLDASKKLNQVAQQTISDGAMIGIKRLYDEKEKTTNLDKWSDISDKIDAHLEMVNATTDITVEV